MDSEAHKREIEEWRANRVERLTSETGWLTLAGLFWLKEGDNTIGSDSTHDVILPKSVRPNVGIIRRTGATLEFIAEQNIEVFSGEDRVSKTSLRSDEAGSATPTILRIGSVRFYVIQRGDKLGVRVKDSESPIRKEFKGLAYFPIDITWRIEARFVPFDEPKTIRIPTTVGTEDVYVFPGSLHFEIDGKAMTLDAALESDSAKEYFIMFGDKTNGNDTYGGGREMYVPIPPPGAPMIIDFNKAYNWPCVFTPYATCPLPPPQNRLPVRVEAGEKMYSADDGK